MESIPHYKINLPEVHHIIYDQHTEWEGATGESTRRLGISMPITLLACIGQYIIHIVDYMRS